LHPQPTKPYRLRTESGNRVVKTLRAGHSGDCLRVLDTKRGPEEGILFHEAPNVTWLIGCISPRPKGDLGAFENRNGNPSYLAMNEIFRQLETHAGGKGHLFVMDW